MANIVSTFQVPSSNGLRVMLFWRFGGKWWPSDWANYDGVCRTAPATPGLLITFPASQASLVGVLGDLLSNRCVGHLGSIFFALPNLGKLNWSVQHNKCPCYLLFRHLCQPFWLLWLVLFYRKTVLPRASRSFTNNLSAVAKTQQIAAGHRWFPQLTINCSLPHPNYRKDKIDRPIYNRIGKRKS